MPDRQAAALDGDERLGEIVHRGLDAGADVERRAVDRVDRREHDIARGQVRLRDVLNEHHVPRLVAVAEHGQRLACEHAMREDRDDPRLTVRVLARAVDIAVPERHRLQPVQPRKRREVVLRGELGGAIRRGRQLRGRLDQRELARVAVHRAPGRSEHHPAHTAHPGALQQVEQAQDIHLRVEQRICYGAPDVHLGRMVVEQREAPLGYQLPRRRRTHIRLHERRPRRHPLPPAGRQVVQYRHVVARRQVRVHHVGPDEPRPARDQDPTHHPAAPGQTAASAPRAARSRAPPARPP